MKQFIVCALVAFLLVACTATVAVRPEPPDGCDRVFTVSSAFTDDERDALDVAAERWNAIATEQFCFVDEGAVAASDIVGGVYPVSPDWARNHFGAEKGKTVIGAHLTATDQIAIVVERFGDLALDALLMTLLHEFGHAHGLAHTADDEVAVMNAVLQPNVHDFTEYDMIECRRVRACK